jgi:hypothetical protein
MTVAYPAPLWGPSLFDPVFFRYINYFSHKARNKSFKTEDKTIWQILLFFKIIIGLTDV